MSRLRDRGDCVGLTSSGLVAPYHVEIRRGKRSGHRATVEEASSTADRRVSNAMKRPSPESAAMRRGPPAPMSRRKVSPGITPRTRTQSSARPGSDQSCCARGVCNTRTPFDLFEVGCATRAVPDLEVSRTPATRPAASLRARRAAAAHHAALLSSSASLRPRRQAAHLTASGCTVRPPSLLDDRSHSSRV